MIGNYYGADTLLIILIIAASPANCSSGDRSRIYQECFKQCQTRKCAKEEGLMQFEKEQSIPEKTLMWSCKDDCGYNCMWLTVNEFKKAGMEVPQFYGKWPFVRIYGIQEPASMIFSIMNGAAHIIGLLYFMTNASPTSPLYYPSIGFGVLAINTWFWSTVFHSRDFPFTEKMDYFCATATVFYSIYYCIHRMSFGLNHPDSNMGGRVRRIAFLLLFIFFSRHVNHLVQFFDYGYNMLVNIVAGLCNGAIWFLYHFLTRKNFTHQWKATYAVIYTLALLGLEVLDFTPIWWTFDAHSLWHLGTVAFPALWYPFMLEESKIVDDTRFKIL